ncbi:hypothetical protein SEA_BIPPER_44 [Mycobacterium phage Bipper]|uniref:Uncharacterized protein n=1 Tax=Mycobacterium phage Bipper TaxID=1805457 RepID=A0A142F2H2_9CAUD|nr:hypothetical protein KCH39_gp133 [Mycobacterium phage Bipper]AMQ66979.1 hypothetical protein SEA_BIPPER_44 [Mycobacterium phage Bipper]
MSRTADLPASTASKMAATHAVGLSYWADHPTASHVWAVDQYQQVHVVKISATHGTAQHVCNRYADRNHTSGCDGHDRVMSYSDPAAIARELGITRAAAIMAVCQFVAVSEVWQPAEEPARPLTLVPGERCPGYGQVVDGDGHRAKCPHCGRSVKRYATGKLGSHRVAA